MTVGSPPSRTVTTELVVPRSIPTARAMGMASLPCAGWWCWFVESRSGPSLRGVRSTFLPTLTAAPGPVFPGCNEFPPPLPVATAPRHRPSPARTAPGRGRRPTSAAVWRSVPGFSADFSATRRHRPACEAVVHRSATRIGRLAAHFRGAPPPAVGRPASARPVHRRRRPARRLRARRDPATVPPPAGGAGCAGASTSPPTTSVRAEDGRPDAPASTASPSSSPSTARLRRSATAPPPDCGASRSARRTGDGLIRLTDPDARWRRGRGFRISRERRCDRHEVAVTGPVPPHHRRRAR